MFLGIEKKGLLQNDSQVEPVIFPISHYWGKSSDRFQTNLSLINSQNHFFILDTTFYGVPEADFTIKVISKALPCICHY